MAYRTLPQAHLGGAAFSPRVGAGGISSINYGITGAAIDAISIAACLGTRWGYDYVLPSFSARKTIATSMIVALKGGREGNELTDTSPL